MWKRYLSPTPANVARLLIGAKTVLVSIAGAEMLAGKPSIGFYILLATGILNEMATFLTNKKEDDSTPGK
jgi:hypothetical protein